MPEVRKPDDPPDYQGQPESRPAVLGVFGFPQVSRNPAIAMKRYEHKDLVADRSRTPDLISETRMYWSPTMNQCR